MSSDCVWRRGIVGEVQYATIAPQSLQPTPSNATLGRYLPQSQVILYKNIDFSVWGKAQFFFSSILWNISESRLFLLFPSLNRTHTDLVAVLFFSSAGSTAGPKGNPCSPMEFSLDGENRTWAKRTARFSFGTFFLLFSFNVIINFSRKWIHLSALWWCHYRAAS